jgi:hypothetical protein
MDICKSYFEAKFPKAAPPEPETASPEEYPDDVALDSIKPATAFKQDIAWNQLLSSVDISAPSFIESARTFGDAIAHSARNARSLLEAMNIVQPPQNTVPPAENIHMDLGRPILTNAMMSFEEYQRLHDATVEVLPNGAELIRNWNVVEQETEPEIPF